MRKTYKKKIQKPCRNTLPYQYHESCKAVSSAHINGIDAGLKFTDQFSNVFVLYFYNEPP